ncbi:MAG: hypothetical protein WBK10_06480 [Bacillota bacterium]|jgi:hypothetical protein|nr:hypothetical protein [Bacillota bacterium]
MAATDIERRWYASGDEIAALLSSLNAFLSGELPEDRVQRINIEYSALPWRLRLRSQIRIDWHRWDYHQCRWKGLDDRLPRFGVDDLAEKHPVTLGAEVYAVLPFRNGHGHGPDIRVTMVRTLPVQVKDIERSDLAAHCSHIQVLRPYNLHTVFAFSLGRSGRKEHIERHSAACLLVPNLTCWKPGGTSTVNLPMGAKPQFAASH